MSELILNDDSWQIERQSPVIRLVMDQDDYTDCTYRNSRVYLFAQPYNLMNHLFINGEQTEDGGQSGVGTYIFGKDELLQTFVSNAFPTTMEPFPTENDLSAYSRYLSGVIELDLIQLDEMGDE